MTPAEVRAVRGLRNYAGDAYGAAGASSRVLDRQSQLQAITGSCKQIELWLREVPGFSDAVDCKWSTDPDSYDLSSEAARQRRLTFMMLAAWIEAKNKDPIEQRSANVIVTQNFLTKFGMITPRAVRAAGGVARVIQVPSGFFDFGFWMNAGLRCWCGFHAGPAASAEGDDGWTLVTSTITPEAQFPLNHISILELIARTLAEKGRDLELMGPNVALDIREQLPWFAGQTGEIAAEGMKPVEGDMSYLVMEFVLAHELAHVLSGDTDTSGIKGSDAEETGAHHIALALLELTSSSRQFGCDPSLLEPVAQSALCLVLFEFFVSCRVVLADMVARRNAGAGDSELLTVDRSRLRLATAVLDERLAYLETHDTPRAAGLLRSFRANGFGFTLDLEAAIISTPDDVMAAAVRIAEMGTP